LDDHNDLDTSFGHTQKMHII